MIIGLGFNYPHNVISKIIDFDKFSKWKKKKKQLKKKEKRKKKERKKNQSSKRGTEKKMSRPGLLCTRTIIT